MTNMTEAATFKLLAKYYTSYYYIMQVFLKFFKKILLKITKMFVIT